MSKKIDAPSVIETTHGEINVVEVARKYLPTTRSQTNYHRDNVELTADEIGEGKMVPINVLFQWDRKEMRYDTQPVKIWRWSGDDAKQIPMTVKAMKEKIKAEAKARIDAEREEAKPAAKKPAAKKPAAKAGAND